VRVTFLRWKKVPWFQGTALVCIAQSRGEGAVAYVVARDSEMSATSFTSVGGLQGRQARSGRGGNAHLQMDWILIEQLTC